MRPSRWASCLLLPKCEEIWMMTLALGRSIAVSPTFDRNSVNVPAVFLNSLKIFSRSYIYKEGITSLRVPPNMNCFFSLAEYCFSTNKLSENTMILSPRPSCFVIKYLSLIHICRCRRIERCRSRWSPYH
eukprot:TRINITY_DN2888_c0_g2_i6.p2 TRINITY_DN2888_c0_g2~~TRINITY_DN2888_c0_g2_i6.p2  ORF type:complete len:130 (-),score=13.23 TRINITY_DN2888_c0_g2_i6:14-403(-)